MSAHAATKDMGEPLLDLQRLVSGIRWRRRFWAVSALVGLLAGIGVGAFLPMQATASARVYVVHKDENSGDDGPMKTDLALLQTTTVAAAAVDRLRIPMTPEKFVGTYTGTVIAGNILEITARGAVGPEAVARTQAVADAFIAVHVSQADEATKAQVDALGKLRDAAQNELDRVNEQIRTVGADAAKQAALVERRGALSSQVSSLDQRAQEASIGSPTIAAGTKIIDAAHVTSRSVLVSAGLYGGIGFLLGLVLGLAMAAVATVARDRPVLRRDISLHLGASVIAQLPAPLRGPRKLVGRSRAEKERRHAATTLARVVREDADGVSVLELGCPGVAAALARDMAGEIAGERPVVLVDDLTGGQLTALADGLPDGVTVMPGREFPPSAAPGDGARVVAVASVAPGSPWTDLRRLAAEALVVIRAGSTETTWLHTVARQLADAGVVIIGVVVVHPDPRDRSDGTLWDALQTAVRGRLSARPAPATADAVVRAAALAALQAAQAALPPVAPHVVAGGTGPGLPAGAGRRYLQPLRPMADRRPEHPQVSIRRPVESTPTEAIVMGKADDRTRAFPVSRKPGTGAEETVALPAQRKQPANGNGYRGANGSAANGAGHANGSPANGVNRVNGSSTDSVAGDSTAGAAGTNAAANSAAGGGSSRNGSAGNGSTANGSTGPATHGPATHGPDTHGADAPAASTTNGAPAPSGDVPSDASGSPERGAASGRGRPAPRARARPQPRMRSGQAEGHPTLKLQPVVRSTPADRPEAS